MVRGVVVGIHYNCTAYTICHEYDGFLGPGDPVYCRTYSRAAPGNISVHCTRYFVQDSLGPIIYYSRT